MKRLPCGKASCAPATDVQHTATLRYATHTHNLSMHARSENRSDPQRASCFLFRILVVFEACISSRCGPRGLRMLCPRLVSCQIALESQLRRIVASFRGRKLLRHSRSHSRCRRPSGVRLPISPLSVFMQLQTHYRTGRPPHASSSVQSTWTRSDYDT